MGRGVHLNENTYHKQSYNGCVSWSVEQDGIKHQFTAQGPRMTLQLIEHNKPVDYHVIKVNKEPWESLQSYYETNPRIPRLMDHKAFMRSWKKAVKKSWNRAGMIRR